MLRDFVDATADAVEAVGTTRFEKYLADATGAVLKYDFITMARYSVTDQPRFLIHSHTFPSHMAELYLTEFIDTDPYVDHWRKARSPGVVWLQDVAYTRRKYADYTRVFLPRIGIKDEIGVFMPEVDGDSLAFFYINRQRRFTAEDVAEVRAVFAAIAALYRLHIRLLIKDGADIAASPSLGRPDRLTAGTGETIWYTSVCGDQQSPDTGRVSADARQDWPADPYALSTPAAAAGGRKPPVDRWAATHGLTPREKDILDLILGGQDTAGISAALSLSVGNVKNHKRRIYAKFGIGSERQLFVRYIAAMGPDAPD